MKPRTIGVVTDGIFHTERSMAKHFFVKFNAWGLDYNALHNQIKTNCCLIHLLDRDTYSHYYTTPNHFIKHGQQLDMQVRRYKQGKKDHLPQIFLSLRHWEDRDEALSPNEMYDLAKKIDDKA